MAPLCPTSIQVIWLGCQRSVDVGFAFPERRDNFATYAASRWQKNAGASLKDSQVPRLRVLFRSRDTARWSLSQPSGAEMKRASHPCAGLG